MADKFIRFTEKIAKLCGIFAAGCLLLSIVLITELVFERYIFRNAITWQTELVTMLLVASTFIGSAYVLSEKGHVNMEYLYSFMSEKSITKLKIFTDTLCLVFFSILFYVSLEITLEAFIKNYNTGTIWGPPLWIPYSSMLIGATLMAMSYIAELIKLIRKLKEL
tara:strand:+ start:69 stop:563 length:495 start_codon:yes stop_codon:yes gene_type:complete